MAKTNKTDFAVLGLLSLEPMSGYDIRKNVQESIGYFWQEGYGQIYPALRRLHARGFVGKKKAKESKGPTRYVYSITSKGRSVLRQWLKTDPEPEAVRIELLLKLFFGFMGRPADQIRQVESLLAVQRQRWDQFEIVEREVLSPHTDDPNYPYWISTVRYGLHLSRARAEWCEETLKRLKKIAKAR